MYPIVSSLNNHYCINGKNSFHFHYKNSTHHLIKLKSSHSRQAPAFTSSTILNGLKDSSKEKSINSEFDSKNDINSTTQQKQPIIQKQQDRESNITAFEKIKKVDEVEFRGEALALWIGGSLAFGAGIWLLLGQEKAEEYFAGYLLEQSLSVDNLFVFILIFNYFKTPIEYQPKVLTYGIITAAVLRLIMILLGVELIQSFKPVLLLFAAILIISSFQILIGSDEDDDEDLSDNFIVKLCQKIIKVSTNYDKDNFFTTENSIKMATPLLLTLAIIEISDVVFAVDSIPAIFGVTLDPFIIYSSNLFAIMSLRSLYSFVSIVMTKLKYLEKAIGLVLGFIGAKMITDFTGSIHISTDVSLTVVAAILAGGVAISMILPEEPSAKE